MKPTLWQTILSVLSAFFGVQSEKTRQRDFESGYPWWIYAFIGIAIVALFVTSLLLIVQLVLR